MRGSRSSALVLLLSALAGSCGRGSSDASAAGGRELYGSCGQCHGNGGGGNRELEAPAIAGLDAWYVEAQLRKFKRGVRGSHPDDRAGSTMRAMAASLQSESDLVAVAAFVEQLPPEPLPAVIRGDTAHGQSLWRTCSGCHGVEAGGARAVAAPPLNRGSDWYQLAQLRSFKRGVRGSHPDDTSGAVMRSVAQTLADDRAMEDVVAYIATLR